MKDQFQLIENGIEEDTGMLHLYAEGILVHPIANSRLRILTVFSCFDKVRRFPMETDCIMLKGISFFSVRGDISLPDIFYHSSEVDAGRKVEVAFEYCDAKGNWHVLPESLTLDGGLFLPPCQKGSLWYGIYRKAAYLLCTLLLPVWLLDGWFVAKGYKKSPYLEAGERGKKAVFYHAHGLVKQITGYGYSMRERKTTYFVKQYKKACKKRKGAGNILFLSERELETGGNLDLVRSYLQEHGENFDEFIDTRPVHKLPYSSIKRSAKLAAAARVIILEDFYPQLHALDLREGTSVVQLWHACGAFKMFGLSDIGKVSHLGQDTKNHRSYSAAIVSSEAMVPFYSEAFGIATECVMPLGVPRTDIFFGQEYGRNVKERLYGTYPGLEGKKVVLFAPTFRGGGNKDAYYPWERFSVDAFVETLPEDAVLVVKNHPFVKQKFHCKEENKRRVLDLTGQENINDILFITSLLITDYSSCIFEASLLALPMIFYVFDLEEYVKSRDIYFDFASFAPGKQVKSFESLKEETGKLLSVSGLVLEEALENGAGQEEGLQAARETEEKRKEFCNYFLGSLDGHSTERVSEMIRSLQHNDGKGAAD